MNTFRHWFMWAAIEVAPGKYDWRDYDRMMDLAAQNGIKVVIAELITAAPEWMFHKYPHARYRASDGTVSEQQHRRQQRHRRLSRPLPGQSRSSRGGREVSDRAGGALSQSPGAARLRPVEREHLQRRQSRQDVLLLRRH